MSGYDKVIVKKLKLKGEKRSHKKHKSKKRKHADEDGECSAKDIDILKNGGWWKASRIGEIKGSVAIQYGSSPVYIKALNQGLFTIGAPHDEGDGPEPEEVLTAIPVGDRHIAFKSGYGKYLSVDSKGQVIGMVDAIGPREQWEPVFEDDKLALLGGNDCFLSVDEDDNVIARSTKAGPEEMVTIRCSQERNAEKDDPNVALDKGKLKEVELNYVKMFQKFQDKKIKINSEGSAELKDARGKGKLHEALLDRRSKMKADRYCK